MHGTRPEPLATSGSPERDSRTRSCVTGSSQRRLDPVRAYCLRRAQIGHAFFFGGGHAVLRSVAALVFLAALVAAASLPAKTPPPGNVSGIARPDSVMPDSVRVVVVPDSLLDPTGAFTATQVPL